MDLMDEFKIACLKDALRELQAVAVSTCNAKKGEVDPAHVACLEAVRDTSITGFETTLSMLERLFPQTAGQQNEV